MRTVKRLAQSLDVRIGYPIIYVAFPFAALLGERSTWIYLSCLQKSQLLLAGDGAPGQASVGLCDR